MTVLSYTSDDGQGGRMRHLASRPFRSPAKAGAQVGDAAIRSSTSPIWTPAFAGERLIVDTLGIRWSVPSTSRNFLNIRGAAA